MNVRSELRRAVGACAMAVTFGVGAMAPAATAQVKESVSRAETATAQVTIKSIDAANRKLVVANEAGESFSLTAPPEVQRFDELKVGDVIKVEYTIKTEFVLSAPNTKLPEDASATVAARAAADARPGVGAANYIVVTGNVVGIDKAKHTLKLVSREGGEVHTITVRSAEGLKAMDKVKVGDTLTAYVTESLVIAVGP